MFQENSEPPAEIVPKAGVVLPNKEGVEAEPRAGADEEAPKAWVALPNKEGVAADPNKVDTGAEVVGVANKEDDMEEDGTEGVLKREKAFPEDAGAGAVAVDAWGAVDAEEVAELANKPAPCVEGCEFAGKCKVGCALLAAASFLALSRRSASRNGSFPSPRRRWSTRQAVFMDSICTSALKFGKSLFI